MFTIIWYIILIFLITNSIVWVIENNGTIEINWLDYNIQTDILTAILILGFFLILTITLSYFLTRILAIKFPELLKFFFRKSYTKKLEKIISNHHQGFETLSKILIALEIQDYEYSKKLFKVYQKQIKYKTIQNFLEAKFAFYDKDFEKSEKIYNGFANFYQGKILHLNAKFKNFITNNELKKALETGNEILKNTHNNFSVATDLIKIYKKNGDWQSTKALIDKFGIENFGEELQKRDQVILNSSLAFESYRNKKYLSAIKFAKNALLLQDHFLPAQEILIKSWAKLGMKFKAIKLIKSIWKENPHIILLEIYDSLNRKSKAKKRINLIKKLALSNSQFKFANLAIAKLAFRVGFIELSHEFLNLAILQEKTKTSYRILAKIENINGNTEEYEKLIQISKALPNDAKYSCNNCGHNSSKWSSVCENCSKVDTLEWKTNI
ncbi:MAG: hypothetical protein ACKO6C_04605 [Alphaproteobacteria bacterium]